MRDAERQRRRGAGTQTADFKIAYEPPVRLTDAEFDIWDWAWNAANEITNSQDWRDDNEDYALLDFQRDDMLYRMFAQFGECIEGDPRELRRFGRALNSLEEKILTAWDISEERFAAAVAGL